MYAANLHKVKSREWSSDEGYFAGFPLVCVAQQGLVCWLEQQLR